MTRKQIPAASTQKLSKRVREAKGQLAALYSIGLHIDRNPQFIGDTHLPAFEATHNRLAVLLAELEEDLKNHDHKMRDIFSQLGESFDYYGTEKR